MWALIKADFHYTRIGLCVIGLFVAFFFVLAANVTGWHFHSFVNNSAVSAMIGMGIMAASADKERRDRSMMALPVPINDVGIVRLIYVAIVFAGLMVVWSAFLVVRPEPVVLADIWVMFNASAIAFMLFIWFSLHHDFAYHESRRPRLVMYALTAGFLVIIAILGVSGEMDEIGPAYGDFLLSVPGVLFHLTLAVLSFLYALRVFKRRKSFLS